MEELSLFLLSFVFVFLIYQFFIVRRAKKNHAKKGKKDPIEISYLVRKYHLDLKKVHYNQLLQIVALVSSFDISLVVSIILLLKTFFC